MGVAILAAALMSMRSPLLAVFSLFLAPAILTPLAHNFDRLGAKMYARNDGFMLVACGSEMISHFRLLYRNLPAFIVREAQEAAGARRASPHRGQGQARSATRLHPAARLSELISSGEAAAEKTRFYAGRSPRTQGGVRACRGRATLHPTPATAETTSAEAQPPDTDHRADEKAARRGSSITQDESVNRNEQKAETPEDIDDARVAQEYAQDPQHEDANAQHRGCDAQEFSHVD
jgi:hypothetical protein